MRGTITEAEFRRALAVPPSRRPWWLRLILSYSFGWFLTGEIVGILLLALVQHLGL